VLGVERVGAHDNFFDLGGHSLLGTQVLARLRDLYAVDVSLKRLFESPTVAGLASAVVQSQLEQEDEDIADILSELNQLSDEKAQEILTELGDQTN